MTRDCFMILPMKFSEQCYLKYMPSPQKFRNIWAGKFMNNFI